MTEVDSGVPAAGRVTETPSTDATLLFDPLPAAGGPITDLRCIHLDDGARRLLSGLDGPLTLRGAGGEGPLDLDACRQVLRTGRARERNLILGSGPRARCFLATLRKEGPRLALALTEAPEKGRLSLRVHQRRSTVRTSARDSAPTAAPAGRDAEPSTVGHEARGEAEPVIWEWFPGRRTGAWSPGAEALFGLAREALEPSPGWLLSCVDEGNREQVRQVLEQTLAAGGGFSLRFTRGGLLNPGAPITLAGRVVQDEGRETRLVAVLQPASPVLPELPPGRETMMGEVAREVIWEWRADLRQVLWGETLRSVFGWAPVDAQGDAWWHGSIHVDDAERVFASIRKAVRSGARMWTQEYRFKRADGTCTPVRNRGALERDAEGRVIRMVGCLTDLAELRAMEEERQQETSFRERFIGILGHDLRTPLNAISLSAQTLRRRTALTETQREVVGRIQSSTARMERMITEILDLTRARLAGGIPVRPSSCDVHALSKRVLKELQAVHPERVFSFEVKGPGAASVDAERLEQAVGNLISNACQHSPAGMPIEVESHAEEGVWSLRVHNWGSPIAPERLPEIFHPFRSGAANRGVHMGPGLGLGLYIVQEIAHAHGGAVTVDSTAEEGTCFVLTIPTQVRTGPAREGTRADPVQRKTGTP